jgi:hypothetical protein
MKVANMSETSKPLVVTFPQHPPSKKFISSNTMKVWEHKNVKRRKFEMSNEFMSYQGKWNPKVEACKYVVGVKNKNTGEISLTDVGGVFNL